MNQPATKERQPLVSDRASVLQVTKRLGERVNAFEPKKNSSWENDDVVDDNRYQKTPLQFGRKKHRLDDHRVVPDIERASEDLRQHRCQRDHY